VKYAESQQIEAGAAVHMSLDELESVGGFCVLAGFSVGNVSLCAPHSFETSTLLPVVKDGPATPVPVALCEGASDILPTIKGRSLILPKTGEFAKRSLIVLSQRRNRLPAKLMYVAAPMAAIRRIQSIASWVLP